MREEKPFCIQCACVLMAEKEHVIKFINRFLCILIRILFFFGHLISIGSAMFRILRKYTHRLGNRNMILFFTWNEAIRIFFLSFSFTRSIRAFYLFFAVIRIEHKIGDYFYFLILFLRRRHHQLCDTYWMHL